MSVVDIIKWESNPNELVHKFQSDGIRLGSQLVVYPSQTAFFVKGGKILDDFICGTYTIKSENIPYWAKSSICLSVAKHRSRLMFGLSIR